MRITYSIILILATVLINGCTEAYDLKIDSIEEALVVEATISNELKFHEIKLSKATSLEVEEIVAESNATIEVKDEAQNSYSFTETSPGIYTSNIQFSAKINSNYQLFIKTANGDTYESNLTKTTSDSKIEDLTVTLGENSENNTVFQLNVSSFDPNGQSNYYRYTYEETYKIVAPYWSPFDIILNPGIEIVPRTVQNQICYQTYGSNDIIQTETTGLTEDRVSGLTIRKIPVTDYKVSHRYSILVKQYVQSFEAYTFYKLLNKFSNASDVLSQSQPGFFEGNIKAVSEPSKKVIGFFEIASVSSKRMFFDYKDFFTDGTPNTPEPCGLSAPSAISESLGEPIPLFEYIDSGDYKFYGYNNTPSETLPGPYLLVPNGCGDCTVYGTNVKPNFWID
ncbi:hypothetical protein GCM10011416_16010 [Polaribacter pacificus]|uniref:DUF4249 domain-containing protein n=1 Tax=Polaribacter pacificus TaxID=1775173 RepID=A0A917HYT5_9FLAO|nr:DUF4249 domain-containing protein [Polaribacter pacificus]GGG98616.1 hypothetical protein GCM10011416_16010 [Polaribacter pacificus]